MLYLCETFLQGDKIMKKNLSLVKKDGGYGITNSESGLIVPCIYDSIQPIEQFDKKIKVSDDLKGKFFVTYYDKDFKGLISHDAVVASPYFPYINIYRSSINLRDNGRYHSDDMTVSIKDSVISVKYDWERDLANVIEEQFSVYFESIYNTAIITGNRTLLEATINARLQNLENRMWAKAEKGESFVKEFEQLRSLCYFSLINLDYGQTVNQNNDIVTLKTVTSIHTKLIDNFVFIFAPFFDVN